MDAEDRELFDRSLRHATGATPARTSTPSSTSSGWADALAEDPETAVALLFEHQGFANATSPASTGC